MKKILFLIILPALFFQFFVFTPQITTARAVGPADLNNQQGFGNGGEISKTFGETSDPKDPREIIGNVIKIVLGLIGIIFVCLLVYAGFTWMTANGEEEKVSKAKETISRAIIGLIIILSAYGVTLFVMRAILASTKSSPLY